VSLSEVTVAKEMRTGIDHRIPVAAIAYMGSKQILAK
jgi:hypothetical protein